MNLSTSVILKDKPENILFQKGNQAIVKWNYFSDFRRSLGKAKKLWRIKATREKEHNYMRDLNHKVSYAVINQALSVVNPVIAISIKPTMTYGCKVSRFVVSMFLIFSETPANVTSVFTLPPPAEIISNNTLKFINI